MTTPEGDWFAGQPDTSRIECWPFPENLKGLSACPESHAAPSASQVPPFLMLTTPEANLSVTTLIIRTIDHFMSLCNTLLNLKKYCVGMKDYASRASTSVGGGKL